MTRVYNIIGWNVEEMERYTHSIDKEISELEEKKKYLMNIDKSIELVFQGRAGAVFDAKLDFDITKYEKMINDMTSLNDAVKKAIANNYIPTEKSIGSRISNLASGVK